MSGRDRELDRREFLRIASAFAGAGALSGALPGLAEAMTAGRWMSANGLPALAQVRPFEMIVLGDSIMWGQGLKPEQKFSHAVQQWLLTRMPGRAVHLHSFAHSGARIKRGTETEEASGTHGEVPNHFPSITRQVEMAQSARPPQDPTYAADNVDLVLMDGGINDFGAKNIANPDPTVGRSWVRRTTRERCLDRMRELLPMVLTTFPNARVVLTNYFQIVSERSDMVLLWELLRAWAVVGDGINYLTAPLRQTMSDKSLAFHEEYTSGLREIVAEVNRPAAQASKPRAGVRSVDARAIALTRPRVVIADVGFGPRNAYGAPETRLFYVNEPDPAASVRKPKCQEQTKEMSAEFPNCLVAAAGHPNPAGARMYADAIIAALKRMVPEWETAPATTAPAGLPVRIPVPGRPPR